MALGAKWLAADIELLTKLWNEGLSGKQIAARFPGRFSRQAVIGKANRLHLAPRDSSHNRGWEHRSGLRPASPVAKPKERELPPAATSAPLPAGPIGAFPDGLNCRWIYGEGDAFQCCAAPGFPYCAHHKPLVSAKPHTRIKVPRHG